VLLSAAKNLFWLALMVGGAIVTLFGIVVAARFGGEWNAELFGWFGPTVDAGFFGLLTAVVGIATLVGGWLLDQRWRRHER
jgi:hypothetical protein